MSATTLPPELLAAAPALAVRFGEIVAGLIAVITRVFCKHPTRCKVIVPLCLWLHRNGQRLARVMRKLEAGQLRPSKPRPGRKSSGKPPLAFPRKRDWLLVELRHEGAHYTHRLRALLAEPEVATLLAATPQAQRLLRPICHIMGVRHASLGIKPKVPNLSPTRAGEGRGPSRSDGKGEGAAARPGRNIPSPLPVRAWVANSEPRKGEGWQPHEPGGLSPPPDPYATLCPRLRTRWPFNQLPRFRNAEPSPK